MIDDDVNMESLIPQANLMGRLIKERNALIILKIGYEVNLDVNLIGIYVRGLGVDHSKCAGEDIAPNVIDLDKNLLGALKFEAVIEHRNG